MDTFNFVDGLLSNIPLRNFISHGAKYVDYTTKTVTAQIVQGGQNRSRMHKTQLQTITATR